VRLLVSLGKRAALSPDARNIPPPTRLGFEASRACLTSLKELDLVAGVDDGGSAGGAVDLEEEELIAREDTGFRSSDSEVGLETDEAPVEAEAVGALFCDLEGSFSEG